MLTSPGGRRRFSPRRPPGLVSIAPPCGSEVDSVLLSMTGYGEARYQSDTLNLSVELRSVNNRYLKVTLRATDPYHLLEPEFEKIIRRSVKRGTLQVHLRLERQGTPQDYRINRAALEAYIQQLRSIADQLGLRDH